MPRINFYVIQLAYLYRLQEIILRFYSKAALIFSELLLRYNIFDDYSLKLMIILSVNLTSCVKVSQFIVLLTF